MDAAGQETAGVSPLVAITTSEVRQSTGVTLTRHGEPPQYEMALGLKYLAAVEAAGGVPVVVPPLHSPATAPLLDHCSGVLLSGGPDVEPSAYAARVHPESGPYEPVLDEFELSLARAADERGVPVLAICRGLQLYNVARGGSLHQHLPDVVGERIAHRQTQANTEITHWVSIRQGSRLAAVVGKQRMKVNSFHHQAVDSLGRGLVPTAWASDGTIEGLEDPARDFAVAVQWHAECLVGRPDQAALFKAFVDAAARFAQTGASLRPAA